MQNRMFRSLPVSPAGWLGPLVLACLMAWAGVAQAQTGDVVFSSSTYSANVNQSNAVITILFSGSTDGVATVDYVTSDGTGVAGVDYTSVSNTSVFAVGTVSNSFDVPLLDNGVPQSTQTVNLALINPTGTAVLGSPATAVLTIINTSSQQVQFAQSSYSVDESNVVFDALITVTRTGGSNGVATVNYNTSDGSALAGIDYTATSGTLTLSDGVASASFSVPILETGALETNKNLHLTLSSPTGAISLGSPATALLTIVATGPPVLQFGAASANIHEHVGRATLTVIRFGADTGAVAVDFATADGPATNGDIPGISGIDYLGTSNILVFADGQSSASFSFQFVKFDSFQSNKTVLVTLSNPIGSNTMGAATLGTQDTELVTIVNDRTQTIGFTNSNGDVATLTLLHAGTMQTNGSPMNLQLSATDMTSVLTVKVKKSKTGTGLLEFGSLTGDGACRLIAAPAVDLVGAGVQLGGSLGQLSVHDIPNAGSILAGDSANQVTRILAHAIGDGTTINVGGRIGTLSVARLGADTITAPSIGTLSARGDKKAMISGDCEATITLSGGASGQQTLGSLFAAGTVSNVTLNVAAGNVGSVAASRILDSTIYVGYTPSNSSAPFMGGTFIPNVRLNAVRASALAGGFANSYCFAPIIGNVNMASVVTTNGGIAFGIGAGQSISSVSVRTPKFHWLPSGADDQSLGDFHAVLY